MRLLGYTYRKLSLWLLLLMAIWGALFYYTIIDEVVDETDDALANYAQIIINNWDDFSDIIPNQAWINSRMDDLEMARNIIMHTGVLPNMELERVDSIVRDMLRQLN